MNEVLRIRVPDIFRLNDWRIDIFILAVLCSLVIYNIGFLINRFFFKAFILLQLLGFINLTFVPGFIILRILRVHGIKRIESFLLAAGLSLSFVMIYGAFLNFLLPFFGILRPMSPPSLLIAFDVGVISLLLASYFTDKGFRAFPEPIDVYISPLTLFLFLPFFLSIFGAYIMTFYDSNVLILILLLLISLIPLLIVFDRIPKNLYPLLIFIVSLSILYHVNLISTHLWSFDIFFEHYAANWVLEKGIWDPSEEFNQLLLISVLAPTYSLLCDLHLVWVFKAIFPFFFALTPLALYHVYEKIDLGEFNFDSKLALLSVLVFVFFYGFFKDMPDKQHIAELFMAQILMLMVSNIPSRVPLSMILSFSLITSHYGVSYLFMLSLIGALILFYVWREGKGEKDLLNPNFVSLFSVLAIGWYIYVARGMVFERVVQIGNHIANKIFEILKPDSRSGITYLTLETPSLLWQAHKLIHITFQVFLALGMASLLISVLKKRARSLSLCFLSIAFYSLLVFQITTTYGMGFDRVLQITLTLLSPFAMTGCLTISKLIAKIKKGLTCVVPNLSVKFFATFLACFFLFNSGFVFEVSKDVVPPYCVALDKNTWESWNVFSESEIHGALWLKKYYTGNLIPILRTDLCKDGMILAAYWNYRSDFVFYNPASTSLPSNSCMYFGSLIVERKVIPIFEEGKIRYLKLNETSFYESVLLPSSKVYDSGTAHIYHIP
jgi:uncharacterized membrane protein